MAAQYQNTNPRTRHACLKYRYSRLNSEKKVANIYLSTAIYESVSQPPSKVSPTQPNPPHQRPHILTKPPKTAISFDKDQQPTSIQNTQPTSFPTALGSPNRSQSPSPEPITHPKEKKFTTAQPNATSTNPPPPNPSETKEKQLKRDLVATQRDLLLARNETQNLRWRMNMYKNAHEIQNRALEETTRRLEDAEAELRVIFRTNDELIDMLRSANETVEKVGCELEIVKGEKSEREKRREAGK